MAYGGVIMLLGVGVAAFVAIGVITYEMFRQRPQQYTYYNTPRSPPSRSQPRIVRATTPPMIRRRRSPPRHDNEERVMRRVLSPNNPFPDVREGAVIVGDSDVAPPVSVNNSSLRSNRPDNVASSARSTGNSNSDSFSTYSEMLGSNSEGRASSTRSNNTSTNFHDGAVIVAGSAVGSSVSSTSSRESNTSLHSDIGHDRPNNVALISPHPSGPGTSNSNNDSFSTYSEILGSNDEGRASSTRSNNTPTNFHDGAVIVASSAVGSSVSSNSSRESNTSSHCDIGHDRPNYVAPISPDPSGPGTSNSNNDSFSSHSESFGSNNEELMVDFLISHLDSSSSSSVTSPGTSSIEIISLSDLNSPFSSLESWSE